MFSLKDSSFIAAALFFLFFFFFQQVNYLAALACPGVYLVYRRCLKDRGEWAEAGSPSSPSLIYYHISQQSC